MKFIKALPVYLLAFIFVAVSLLYFGMVSGLVPMPPIPPGVAGDFSVVLESTGYMNVVKVLELAIGIMLFVPRTRKVALVLIAPIAFNIFLYDVFLARALGAGIFLLILNAIGLYQNREAYRGML